MQIQLDPNIPTNLTPEQMRDFKTFLDHALDSLTVAAGGQLFTLGNQMLGALALIVVVMTGAKIAFGGNIQPWELVRVVIGIWIPWVMLQFYTTTIPGMWHTFPGMIAAGGNWINDLLIDDSVASIQEELTKLFNTLTKAQNTAIELGDVLKIYTTGLQSSLTAVAGFVMVIFMVLMLILLAAVTYAQVIWAQVALAILIILGPVFIPFLVFEPLSFLFWGWFRAMITYSLYAVIAGAVLRIFSAVGIAYVTTLAQADMDMDSFMEVGIWTLAVVPFFIAGMLAALKCGELASMLVTGGGAGGKRSHGHGQHGGNGSGQRRHGGGGEGGRRDQMKKPQIKDAGAEYAEIWGEAIHTNRHLRVISVGLAIGVLLLIVVVIRIVSVEPPRPIVVRVDEVGRAEAVAYKAMEAQADPLDPTTKYFLNRFIYDFYSRRRATVAQNWSRSLRFLSTQLANASFRADSQNVALLAAGVARGELQVARVILRIQPNPQQPHSATADFDLVRMEMENEVGRERWTLSLQFQFLQQIPTDLIVFNPMGIVITYLQGDRATVTGDQ